MGPDSSPDDIGIFNCFTKTTANALHYDTDLHGVDGTVSFQNIVRDLLRGLYAGPEH